MTRAVSLQTLIENIEDLDIVGDTNVFVNSVTANSRKITQGSAFIAVKGFTVDAHEFIGSAISAGASVIFGERPFADLPIKIPSNVTYVQLQNARKSIGIICANFYDRPSQNMTVIGVTGTDGKTTTCHILYTILQAHSIACGMISTLGAYIGDEKMDTGLHVTSPDPEDVQHALFLMSQKGVTHVVLEVTSHGLDQDRFSGVTFTISVLTNITHEHLDYHKTFENYRNAKLKLFLLSKTAVLNADDPSFEYIKNSLPTQKVVSYGIKNSADWKAVSIETKKKISFVVHSEDVHETILTRLIGEFNVYNCLAGVAVSVELGLPLQITRSAIQSFLPPKGRLEAIKNSKGLKIFVDFAHTPNGLEKLLKTLNAELQVEQKLIAVFGSAGERDKTKRFLMGAVAGKIASLSVVTAEDPRTETVTDISGEIIKGIESVDGKYIQIDDRGKAIAEAINTFAKSGDIVVICGKGHETSMAFGKKEFAWSDQKAVLYALQNKVLSLEELHQAE